MSPAPSSPAGGRRGRVVTVAVNAFHFKEPVYVTDVVSFYAQVVKVGTTSITIGVEVWAERGLRSPTPGGSSQGHGGNTHLRRHRRTTPQATGTG